MDKNIRKLWNGEITPQEDGLYTGAEYRKIIRELDTYCIAFEATLTDE